MAVYLRRRFKRSALRAFRRTHARLDRFKLTRKGVIRETLLADAEIAAAVREHSSVHKIGVAQAWRRVEEYIDEIVPFFNLLTYYRIGLIVSETLLNFFYKVSAEYAGNKSSTE